MRFLPVVGPNLKIMVASGNIHDRRSIVANRICSSWIFARARHMLYRFRTVFRVRNDTITWYESCVRLISLSNFPWRASVSTNMWVVIVVYSYMFRYKFVIIRRVHFKIQNTGSVRTIDIGAAATTNAVLALQHLLIMLRHCRIRSARGPSRGYLYLQAA